MEAQDAIRYLPTKPGQEKCLVHILNGGDVVALLPTGFGKKLNLSIVNDRSKKQVRVSFLFQYLNIAMSCCNLAIKLQHFRKDSKGTKSCV